MSTSNVPTEKDYDPIKNPRPEDLHAYGIGNALIWLAVVFAIAMLVYWLVF
jgi:hypothetical protein